MWTCKLVSLAGMAAVVFSLTACDVSAPSSVNIGKIILHDQMVAEALPAAKVDRARVNVLSDGFLRRGKGEMVLNMPYLQGDPAQKKSAAALGDAYKGAFERRGVSNISIVMVPVADSRHADKIIVTYNALAALPPKGCGPLPGSRGADNLEAIESYHLGCDMQTEISRMIVDPADLAGRAGVQNNDSSRSSTVIDSYKAGKPNQSIKGFQGSGIGG